MKDLTGQVFGYLTVIKMVRKPSLTTGKLETHCECLCACGNPFICRKDSLIKRKDKSCGCKKLKDLTGQRFGKLLVLERGKKETSTHTCWKCLCDCGNIKIITQEQLLGGGTNSCGCSRRDDLIGKRFGKLLVISFNRKQNRDFYWNCICDCGNNKIASSHTLKKGETKSCGCLKKLGGPRRECQESSLEQLYASYKRGADKRGLSFVIDLDLFSKMTKENCFYCGCEPYQKHTEGKYSYYIYNGLDRIDSTKGYDLDNIVPCCGRCNAGKTNLSSENFLSWIERVYNYSIKAKK